MKNHFYFLREKRQGFLLPLKAFNLLVLPPLLGLILSTLFCSPLMSQSFNCGTPDPNPQLYTQMRDLVPTIKSYAQSRDEQAITQLPVYFTVARKGDGSLQGINPTQAFIDGQIDYLNNIYVGAGIHFYRLGNVNYIDDDNLGLPNFNGVIPENYSYVKTAFNVYIRDGSVGFGTQYGQNSPSSPYKNNVISLNPITFGTTGVYAHETGHNLGLLHTFGVAQRYNYPQVLTDETVIDHPVKGVYKRELVIRAAVPQGTKPFIEPNCDIAGDFWCDTQADAYNDGSYFPEFDPTNIANCLANSINCTKGCPFFGCYTNCTYTGTYRDYNGDLPVGEPANIMATTYHTVCNPLHLSLEQLANASYYATQKWNSQIFNVPINVADKVEIKGVHFKLSHSIANGSKSYVCDKKRHDQRRISALGRDKMAGIGTTEGIWRFLRLREAFCRDMG